MSTTLSFFCSYSFLSLATAHIDKKVNSTVHTHTHTQPYIVERKKRVKWSNGRPVLFPLERLWNAHSFFFHAMDNKNNPTEGDWKNVSFFTPFLSPLFFFFFFFWKNKGIIPLSSSFKNATFFVLFSFSCRQRKWIERKIRRVFSLYISWLVAQRRHYHSRERISLSLYLSVLIAVPCNLQSRAS